MTYPPNLQRPLSGNKIGSATALWRNGLLTAFLALSVSSCALFQKGTSGGDPVVLAPRGPEQPIDSVLATLPDPMGVPVDSIRQAIDAVALDPPVIAWLLPFTLDQRSLEELRTRDEQKRNRPLVGLGFWEGALLAADTLRRQGIPLDLYAFDTRNSPDEVRRIGQRPEMANVDLIIGPVFNRPMQEALAFAKQKGIRVVSPLRAQGLLPGHDNLYAVLPPNDVLIEQLGEYLEASRRRDNIIVLRRDSAEEVRMTERFLAGFRDTTQRDRITVLVSDYKLNGLIDTLSLVGENAIIVPSRDEVFVNAVTRTLATVAASGEYQLTVYGLPEWRRFESIPPDYLDRIHWHYPTHYWSEESTGFTQAFEAGFRKRFHGPPSELSYLGYDLTLFFAHRLLEERRNKRYADEPMPSMDKYPGMNDAFRFEPTLPPLAPVVSNKLEATWVNRQWHLVRYHEFGFEVVLDK